MAIGNHLSSVIDFHIPEALRDENPQFVKFLKSYYQFLESIQLCSTNVTGTFVEGTVLTGTTSKATGKILSVDTSKNLGEGVYIYVHPTNGSHFDDGEIISTSTGSATLSHYRRNPLNARDSTWDWSDVNSPNNEYIYNYRHELFENFPENIQIDKKLLAKHIKELYLDKGNERSYKSLFRLAFGQVKGRIKEHLEFYYPKNDLLKLSDGQWIQSTTLQVSQLASNYDFLAKDVVGQTSGAKGFITELALKKISTVNVIELYLKNMIGKFSLGETIQATTPNPDGTYANTVLLGMIATDPTINAISVINPGNGYTGDGNIFFENKIPLIGGAGVGQEIVVGKTSNDQVTNLSLTGRGFGYSNNDVIDFDNTGKDPQSSAQAKVSSLLEGTTSTVSVNDQKVYELTNTHVITLSTETDIPIRKGFLLSNHSVYNHASSTKRGVVLEAFSNTVFRYSVLDGIPFTTTDTLNAFREDEFAYTPHLSSGVESNFEYSNDVYINQSNYNDNSSNTSYSGIFGQRLENFTTENPSNLITEDGDQLISELFRPITNSSTSLSGILDYSDKTIGQIGTIEITDFGRLYKGTPTVSVKVNEDFQEVNGLPDTGIGPYGNNGAIEVATMGGQIQDIIVRNPGAAFTTVVPSIDFTGFGDGTANATLLLDSVRYYDGYYVGTDGQLSSQKKLQDSEYYQDFSYVILADQDISTYKDLVLNTVHPAGTVLFGEVIVRSEIEAAMFDQGRNSINTLDARGFTQYRDLMLIIESPLIDAQIPEKTIKSDRNWEFFMETQPTGVVYIDGIPLKDGTISTVASNRMETHRVDKESGFEKIWDDVRFWSKIQSYELGVITPYYIKTYIDMSTFNIASTTTEYTFDHTYEPNTLQIYIGDRLVKQSDITQTSGTSFTLRNLSPTDIQGSGLIHNAPLTIISSYIKVKQRPQNVTDGGATSAVSHETTTDGGNAYLYTNFESYVDGGSAVLETAGAGLYLSDDEIVMISSKGTLGDTLRNQKLLTKNVNITDSTVILIRGDGYYFDDYTNLTTIFDGADWPKIYKVSDELWTKSTIEFLQNERVGYYSNEKIYNYNWHSPTNDMTNIFSSDDEFFVDRRKLESLDSIILEDGDSIVSELNNFTIRMEGVIVGGPNATDWPFLISDYQFHTIKSVDPYKITLHQPVRYRENYGWDNSASSIPALFTLENQTIMKRT